MHIEIAEDIAPEIAEILKILVMKHYRIHKAGSVKLVKRYSDDQICTGCGQKCNSEEYFVEDDEENPIHDFISKFILCFYSCDCSYTWISNVGTMAVFCAYGGTATCDFWKQDGGRNKIDIKRDEAEKIMETKLIELEE